MKAIFTSFCLSVAAQGEPAPASTQLAPSAGSRPAGPSPGNVFREYSWTTEKLHVFSLKTNLFILPAEVDLKDATRAEIVVELANQHMGFEGMAIRLNSNQWYSIRFPASSPQDPSPSLWFHHWYPTIPIALRDLKEGKGNTIEMKVPAECYDGKIHPNGKVSADHPLGEWGPLIPWCPVYGVTVRVYYDPARKPHPTGKVLTPAPQSTIGLSVALTASAKSDTSDIRQIDFIGRYEDINYEGDGIYDQWHGHLFHGQITHHLGSTTQPDGKVTWDTSWVPDQPGPMEIAARITDSTGLIYMTEAVGGLKLVRPGLSVELCKPFDVPRSFTGCQYGEWVIPGIRTQKFTVKGDLSRILDARYVIASWGGLTLCHGYQINGVLLEDKPAGADWLYNLSTPPIRPLTALKPGENTFATVVGPGRVPDIYMPGVQVLIRYRTGETATTPARRTSTTATSSQAEEQQKPGESKHLRQLRVSDNQRFLVTSDSKPFFWLGDTAWELFHRLNREETERYLADRAAKGFNVIQAVALAELDGLTVPNPQGHLPLVEGQFLRPAVVEGPDNDYWDDIEWTLRLAERKGLYVGLLPMWGKYCPADTGNGERYGRFIGERFKDHSNLIWILGGDRPAPSKQEQDAWRAMAKGIAIGVAGREDYDRVLMTYHTFGPDTSSKYFHEDPWLDFNGIQSSHGNAILNWKVVERDYQRQPTKPVIDLETSYPGIGLNNKAPGNEDHARRSAYWAVFSGAFGHTYGNNSIWQMYAPNRKPMFGVKTSWPDALDAPSAVQMGYLRRLIESHPFLTQVPDPMLLSSSEIDDLEHVAALRGDGYALFYAPTGKPFRVRLEQLSGKAVSARWFDPRTGKSSDAGRFATEAEREFTPPGTPGVGNDWVLMLNVVRPRVVIMSDFPPIDVIPGGAGSGPSEKRSDPDDVQSMVRLLLYANDLEVEGLVASAGTTANVADKRGILDVLDLYDRVDNNLRRHDPRYPAADHLRSVTWVGRSGTYGRPASEIIGPGMDSEASEAIITAVDRPDPRPLWFCAWGGPRELAQALWKIRETRTPAETAQFVRKIRVYLIALQDGTGQWLLDTFPDLFVIHSSGNWGGMLFDAPGSDSRLADLDWLNRHVRKGHGVLGQCYPESGWDPKALGVKEGDSPSFLHLVSGARGLNDPEQPDQPGWGGRFLRRDPARNHWTDDPAGPKTVWRWREQVQEDFAKRMDWCVDEDPRRATIDPHAKVAMNLRCSQQTNDIDVYDFLEVTVRSDPPVAGNPFTDVVVSGEFSLAKGGVTLKVDGFCDSQDGSVYRIRFMPSQPGEYRYKVTLSHSGSALSHEGKFTARRAPRLGLLRVDPKHPFHFIWEGTGEHYFWNGTTSYYLMGWESDEMIRQIIDRLSEHKVNRIRVLLYGRNEDRPWGQPVRSTDAFKLYLNPWTAQRPDNVKDPGFDLHRFNVAYWQRYERMLAYARQKSMVVSVIPFIAGQVLVTPYAAYSEEEKLYYRYAVARLAAFCNITWDLGNEHDLHWEAPRWADYMGPLVKQWDPYDHLTSVHNRIYRSPGSPWNDMQLVQRWDAGGQNSFFIEQRKQQAGCGRIVPLINEEYGYEDLWEKKPGDRSADSRRRCAWEICMAGAYQTTGESANRGTGFPPDTGGGWINGRGDHTMTMLHGYRHLVNFFTSFDWWRAEPRNDLVQAPAVCLAETGQVYAVYLPGPSRIKVKLEGAESYRARWFNPRTGEWAKLSDAIGPEWESPEPPGQGDWALLITAYDWRTDAWKSYFNHDGLQYNNNRWAGERGSMFVRFGPPTATWWTTHGGNRHDFPVSAPWVGVGNDWGNVSSDSPFPIQLGELEMLKASLSATLPPANSNQMYKVYWQLYFSDSPTGRFNKGDFAPTVYTVRFPPNHWGADRGSAVVDGRKWRFQDQQYSSGMGRYIIPMLEPPLVPDANGVVEIRDADIKALIDWGIAQGYYRAEDYCMIIGAGWEIFALDQGLRMNDMAFTVKRKGKPAVTIPAWSTLMKK